jgi:hypothetical protein
MAESVDIIQPAAASTWTAETMAAFMERVRIRADQPVTHVLMPRSVYVDNWRVTHAAAEWRPCLHCGLPTRGRTRREWSSHTGEWCFSQLCHDPRPEPNRHDRKRAAKVAS